MVRTMHAPARMTSARAGCSPGICRRPAASEAAVELDLTVDLGAVQDRPLDDVRVVGGQSVAHRCQVRHGTAHRHNGVRARPPIEAAELRRDRRDGIVDDVGRHRPRQPEPLGEPDRADVETEPFVDGQTVTERELRAATTGVEDDDRPVVEPDAGRNGEIGEPALFLSRDHFDREPRPGPHLLDDLGLVSRDAQARRPHDGVGADLETAGLVGHLADCLRGPIERLGADLAGGLETLAQPGHHGSVDDGPPGTAVRVELREVELGRVRARVDDGIALRHRIDQHPEPRRDVVVDVGAEAERLDRGHARPRGPWTRRRSTPSVARRPRARCARPGTRQRCSGRAVCARAAGAARRGHRPRRLPGPRPGPGRRNGRSGAAGAGSGRPCARPLHREGTPP